MIVLLLGLISAAIYVQNEEEQNQVQTILQREEVHNVDIHFVYADGGMYLVLLWIFFFSIDNIYNIPDFHVLQAIIRLMCCAILLSKM